LGALCFMILRLSSSCTPLFLYRIVSSLPFLLFSSALSPFMVLSWSMTGSIDVVVAWLVLLPASISFLSEPDSASTTAFPPHTLSSIVVSTHRKPKPKNYHCNLNRTAKSSTHCPISQHSSSIQSIILHTFYGLAPLGFCFCLFLFFSFFLSPAHIESCTCTAPSLLLPPSRICSLSPLLQRRPSVHPCTLLLVVGMFHICVLVLHPRHTIPFPLHPLAESHPLPSSRLSPADRFGARCPLLLVAPRVLRRFSCFVDVSASCERLPLPRFSCTQDYFPSPLSVHLHRTDSARCSCVSVVVVLIHIGSL
jgi:hypothetical protein